MTKKIFTFLGIAATLFAIKANAQQPTTTFVLTQAPCNNNGVLTANFTNLPTPYDVEWHLPNNVTVTHTGVTTSSDALTGYSGAPVSVYATSSPTSYAYSYYQGALPFDYSIAVSPAVCPALPTAIATPTGGTAPYTYQWTDAATNAIVSTTNPLSAATGVYNILITDANGCTVGSYSHSDSTYLVSEAPFNFTVTATNASCTNGTATVGSFTGTGVAPYTYQWSNGATSSSISGLTTGTYVVTVTDAQGCHRVHDKDVLQSVTINANPTVTQASCAQNNGSIITFGSGGVPPYSYHYSNGVNAQTNSGLTPGSYSVLVTDANGCVGHANAYVGSSSPVSVTYSVTPSSCSTPTGSATLSITGGQPPYVVSWSTYPAQSGTTVTGLAAGNYAFHVTDANGCTREATVVVPPVNVVSVSSTNTNPTCTQSNGSITTLVTGGAAPYTYHWNDNSTAANLTGIPAGSYGVTVTDANGCHGAMGINISSVSPVHVGLATTPASCIYSNDASITSTVWGGVAPYTYHWSNGSTNPSVTGLGQGVNYLTVTDANGCSASEMAYVTYNPGGTSCYCTISGTVYNDANGNCIMDAGETGIPNIAINCTGYGAAYTDANGLYSFHVPSGTYTLSQSVLATYPLATCQNNAIAVTTVAATGCVQTVNFADVISPIHDINISLWQNGPAVPGNPHGQICIVSNQGSIAESNIIAGYKTDGQLNAPAISPSGIFSNPLPNYYTTVGSSFPTLAPGANTVFNMSYNVPTNIPINTQLTFDDSAVYSAPMTTWINDYSPWNNVNHVNETVVSSFDPNFMQVNTQGEGAPGYITRNDSTLNYMVHFQNEGTYFAQNIVVIDTLSDKLDWKSLRPIYSSHKAAVTVDENGVLKYTFKNIQLPAKMNDDPGSNGMFVYSIKLKSNLPYGTEIKNDAGIYFDYNAPVVTNSVLNTIKNPTGVNIVNNHNLAFSVYPNPTQSGFTAVVDNKTANALSTISITDISGRVLLTKELKLAAGRQLVPMSTVGLKDGIYFVNMNIGGNKGTQKLVIVK